MPLAPLTPFFSCKVLNSCIAVLLFGGVFKNLTSAKGDDLPHSELCHGIWHHKWRCCSNRKTEFRCHRWFRIALVNMYIRCKAGVRPSTWGFEASQHAKLSRLCQIIIGITLCERVWKLFKIIANEFHVIDFKLSFKYLTVLSMLEMHLLWQGCPQRGSRTLLVRPAQFDRDRKNSDSLRVRAADSEMRFITFPKERLLFPNLMYPNGIGWAEMKSHQIRQIYSIIYFIILIGGSFPSRLLKDGSWSCTMESNLIVLWPETIDYSLDAICEEKKKW
jgi:hypothetical protein